jgi:hypothetical protein
MGIPSEMGQKIILIKNDAVNYVTKVVLQVESLCVEQCSSGWHISGNTREQLCNLFGNVTFYKLYYPRKKYII